MTNWKETTITTLRLILRPWQESDAEDLYRFASDPLVGPPAGWAPHTDVENSREIIRGILSAEETYAIILRYDMWDAVSGGVIPAGTAVGSVGIMFKGHGTYPHIRENEAEIGYWLCRPLWGRGLVPEAVKAIEKRCFTALDLERLWCSYYDGNDQSRRVQQKCGFVFCGEQRMAPHPLNGATMVHFSCLQKWDWALGQRQVVTHPMTLQEAPFEAFASGRKTVELRLCDPKRQLLRVGDMIEFKIEWTRTCHLAEVQSIRYFPSFEALYAELLPTLGAEALGYREGEIPHPSDMLRYYSQDNINYYGVLAIECR